MHVLWCYIFVDYLDMGARGAGTASSISFFTLMVTLYKYTDKKLDKEVRDKAWFSPFNPASKADCFDKKGLIDYFKQGVPSTCMQCMESWAFHLMTLLSALISVKATAVQVISLNIGALFYMPTLGLQITGSNVIGPCIGARDIINAKIY
jgi:Na+-driven multidrug efflux pump